MNVYKWYKASRVLYLHHIPLLPGLIKGLIRVLWAAVIPYQADIGEGTIIGYQGLGVVIHKRCVIGKNCHISQNVTLGGTSDIYEVPVVGDNVTIGAGANVIGPIKIGDNFPLRLARMMEQDRKRLKHIRTEHITSVSILLAALMLLGLVLYFSIVGVPWAGNEEPEDKPAAEAVTESVTEAVTESVTEEATVTAYEAVSESTAESTDEAVSESTTEEASEAPAAGTSKTKTK